MNLTTEICPLIAIKNTLVLLKLMAQSEEDIKNNRFESQESFFDKIEQKLA